MTAAFASTDLPDDLRSLYAPTGASTARTQALASLYPGLPLSGPPVTLVRSTVPPKPSLSSRTPRARNAGCLAEAWIRRHMTRKPGTLSNHEALMLVERAEKQRGLEISLDTATFPHGPSNSDCDQRPLLVRTPGLVEMGSAWVLFGDQSACLVHDGYGAEGLIYPLAFRLKHPRQTDVSYSFRVNAPSVQQKGDLHIGFSHGRLRMGQYPSSAAPYGGGGYITARFSFLDARLIEGRMSGCMSKSARSATAKTDRTRAEHTTREALRLWAEAMTRTAEILTQHPEGIRLHGAARRLHQSGEVR